MFANVPLIKKIALSWQIIPVYFVVVEVTYSVNHYILFNENETSLRKYLSLLLFNPLSLMTIITHLRSMFRSPGYVPIPFTHYNDSSKLPDVTTSNRNDSNSDNEHSSSGKSKSIFPKKDKTNKKYNLKGRIKSNKVINNIINNNVTSTDNNKVDKVDINSNKDKSNYFKYRRKECKSSTIDASKKISKIYRDILLKRKNLLNKKRGSLIQNTYNISDLKIYNSLNANKNSITANNKKNLVGQAYLDKFNLDNNSYFNHQQNKNISTKKRNITHTLSSTKIKYSSNSLDFKKSINETIDKSSINNMNLNLNITSENNSYSLKNQKKAKSNNSKPMKNKFNNKCSSNSNLSKKRL